MKPFAKKRLMRVAVIVAAITALSACSSGTPSGEPRSATVGVNSTAPTLQELYTGYESAPPADGPAGAKKKKVALISCGEVYPTCAAVGVEAQKAADVLGWDFKVFDGAGNVGGGFATAIRSAIATAPDAIIPYGMDCAAVKQPLKEAKDAGIVIIGLENLDCDESGDGGALFTQPLQYNKDAIGGAEYWANYGKAAAAYIANIKPNAKILTVGTWDEPLGRLLSNAFKAGLAKWCPDCKIVDEVSGTTAESFPGGPIEQRYQAAQVKNTDIDVIYSPYDNFLGSTLNIAKNVRDAGLREKILLVGGLGGQEGLGLLRGGDIDADPHAVDKGWLAWGAFDQLNRIFNNADPVPQGVGPRLLDKTQDLGTSGAYTTSVNYKKAYEAIWKK